LGFEKIGLRNGGVVRAETPMLFWTRFAVELLFASVFWLAGLFLAITAMLRLRASRK
jgi:hypothetical protein